jgi:hypothetical protein
METSVALGPFAFDPAAGRLAETAEGTQIWACNFDGVQADLFDMQDRIRAGTPRRRMAAASP